MEGVTTLPFNTFTHLPISDDGTAKIVFDCSEINRKTFVKINSAVASLIPIFVTALYSPFYEGSNDKFHVKQPTTSGAVKLLFNFFLNVEQLNDKKWIWSPKSVKNCDIKDVLGRCY